VNEIRKVGWLALLVIAVAQAAQGAETGPVAWSSDLNAAWQAAQQQGRPLLVFVTRADCYYCTQMKDRTWNHAAVTRTIQQSYIPFVLDGGQASPLLKELNVKAYPSTFIISPQAVILDRMDGFVAPEALAQRLQSLRNPVSMVKMVKDP